MSEQDKWDIERKASYINEKEGTEFEFRLLNKYQLK
jgi:hypothetical protein